MRTTVHKTAQLGDLIVAVFDEAAQYSNDPPTVSRLATRAVMHLLRQAENSSDAARRLASRGDLARRAGSVEGP